jgi:uncharacterized protein (DUF4213/DUF364 family)
MPIHNALFDQLLSILPDGKLVSVQVGLYWTAVVVEVDGKTRCCLAATVTDESHHFTNGPSIPTAGTLTDYSARDLAALVYYASPPEVSIGMAAVNALLPRLSDRWTEIHAEEVLARHGAGKKVALVGHFPFVPRLRPRVGTLWVLEQDPPLGSSRRRMCWRSPR